MPQRDREQRLTRTEKLAGVEQQKAQAKSGIATWDERPPWGIPHEITGGGNGHYYLDDPRPLDQPDIPYEQYAAEMDRREQNDPYPDWEPSAEAEPPHPVVRPWEDSYRVPCAMRHYVYPSRAPKVKKLEPIDAPEQTDLEIE